jgi:UDP-2,4-diacetamido-2,4,6-trideoxy-beta-L-altropyranose hydrolase
MNEARTMVKGPIVFRTDASGTIGTGHLMRCYALADAFIDNGENVIFALIESLPALDSKCDVRQIPRKMIDARIGSQEDSRATAAIAKEMDAEWVVIDGYQFDSSYQNELQNEGLKVLMIDDFAHAEKYSAEIVLNQNASAKPSLYEGKLEASKLLLGPRYAVVRHEFRHLSNHRKEPVKPVADRILVTLGGSDPSNKTAQVLSCLKEANAQQTMIDIVIGAANNNYDEIKRAFRSCNFFHFVQNPPNLAEIMKSADLAIVSGGTSTYELCYLGTPFITVIIADNQMANAVSLQERGITVSIEGRDSVDCKQFNESIERLCSSPDNRARMKKGEVEMVDGYGVDKILMHLRGARIWLRKAVLEDERRILEWSNEQATRANSFHPERIQKDIHSINFRKWLSSDQTVLLIASNDDSDPIGQVRFDLSGNEADISISLDQRFRGMGLGTEMIRYSCRMVMELYKVHKINAFVKTINDASKKAFESAGFVFASRENKFGQECFHYIIKRG